MTITRTILITFLLALIGFGQQASIALTDADAALCLHDETEWFLTKTAVTPTMSGDGPVAWTIVATRGATSAGELSVNGFVRVTNSGAMPAIIGNIVVSLQRRLPVGNKMRWVSVSADVADATAGDLATTALIVAAASQEDPTWNAAHNLPATYATSGDVGTFSENAASGSLEFMDALGNTISALDPDLVIPPWGTVALLFVARFDNGLLAIPSGEEIRAEVIVSFGNAGARGGGRSVADDVDIDGNGVIDPDEAHVRSVPIRISRTIPTLGHCHDSVLVTDNGLTATGTVGWTNFADAGLLAGLTISQTSTWTVTAAMTAGSDGGLICNEVVLQSPPATVAVAVGSHLEADPVTGDPVVVIDYHDFVCCAGIDLQASDCIQVAISPPPFQVGEFCTNRQGQYGVIGPTYDLFALNWAVITAFSAGEIEIGIPGPFGHSARFTSPAAVLAYLPQLGQAGAFSGDTVDPTSTSAGRLGGQLLALELNVRLSDAAILPVGFGNLMYLDGTSSLFGLTVRQIMAEANLVLGGSALPSGYSYDQFNELVAKLNESFPLCTPTPFAMSWLCK